MTDISESPTEFAKKRAAQVFGVWGLAIFTFSFLANVNATPQLATFGLGSILLFIMAIVLFLTPTAMASAEMGAGWPRTGGIYVWTRLAFGEGPGFMIIWLEWAGFVVAWPGLMVTLASQATYAIDPNLSNSKAFLVPIAVLATWLAAGLALRGLRVASVFAWYSVIAGTLIPSVVLVGFAIVYLAQGHAPAMEVSVDALVPDLGGGNIAFVSGALLMFSGIEISAIHAGNVSNPGRTIPRSNLIAVILCFLLFAPMTLAIATLIPGDQINIVTGLVAAGDYIFGLFGMSWLGPIFGIMLATGLIASLVQIINGPSRGLMIAGRQGGNLPRVLQKENAQEMPVAIIIGQAIISSVLALGVIFLGSIQNAWFMFLLIQTNMTLILYTMMLAAVIKLRFSRPDVERAYEIPGKKVGLFVVTGAGILVCLFGFLISFIPTEEAAGMSTWAYVLVLLLGTAAFVSMPFVFWIFRKPSWKVEGDLDPQAPEAPVVSPTIG